MYIVHRPLDVLLVGGLNDILREATLPFPLKITVIKKDHRRIVNNCRDLMVSLTTKIRESNRSDIHPIIPTRLALFFHTWGIRTRKSPHFKGPKTHRMGQWRETKPKDMLHLEDKAIRIRMGKTCIGYYKAIYRMTECRARSKNEGLKLSREKRI